MSGASGVADPDGAPPAARSPFDRPVVHTALRVAGGVVAVALAAVSALIEIFYSPLRVGGVLVGASAVVAVVANFWLLRYTVAVTSKRWPALLPPLVWFGLMMAASGRRDEGDLLLADGNWVALATIFGGSVAFAVAGYRLIVPPATPGGGLAAGLAPTGDRPPVPVTRGVLPR